MFWLEFSFKNWNRPLFDALVYFLIFLLLKKQKNTVFRAQLYNFWKSGLVLETPSLKGEYTVWSSIWLSCPLDSSYTFNVTTSPGVKRATLLYINVFFQVTPTRRGWCHSLSQLLFCCEHWLLPGKSQVLVTLPWILFFQLAPQSYWLKYLPQYQDPSTICVF